MDDTIRIITERTVISIFSFAGAKFQILRGDDWFPETKDLLVYMHGQTCQLSISYFLVSDAEQDYDSESSFWKY